MTYTVPLDEMTEKLASVLEDTGELLMRVAFLKIHAPGDWQQDRLVRAATCLAEAMSALEEATK